MKAQEMNKKTVKELKDELINLLQEQFNLRMQRGAGDAPKPHLFSRVRRDIARIKTILTQKEAENV
jgi:large subunit ribosomal protein L29